MNRKKILLVEDSTTFATLLIQNIKSELDVELIWLKTYNETRDLLKTNNDDFFIGILDLNLPDAGMGDIVDLIISYNIPSIVVTATLSDEIQKLIWSKRVVDYVIKEGPNTIDYLINLLHRIINNHNNKILIVDDSNTSRLHLKKLLELHRYNLIETTNGLDALNILDSQNDIKIVLTNYNMPTIDGFELTRRIRIKYPIHKLAIIGISGADFMRTSIGFIKYGANDFLSKPVISEQLYHRIAMNINLLDHFNIIKTISMTDHLTGLKNRRYFFNVAPLIHKKALRDNSEIAIAMIDIDHFKQVNDSHGHKTGDEVLKNFSRIISTSLRESDIVTRFGGEEFCVLITNSKKENCFALFEKLRAKIGSKTFKTSDISFFVTVSIGICCEKGMSLESMIKDSDDKLYKAKKSGRNRVEI